MKYSEDFIQGYVNYLAVQGKADAVIFLDPIPTGTLSPEMFEEYSVAPVNRLSSFTRKF